MSSNPVARAQLQSLITETRAIFAHLEAGTPPVRERPEPPVPIGKTVSPDHIVSLEDGKKYRSLTQHLRQRYGMTPEEYRAKWGLPDDYPMVAPSLSELRSRRAKLTRLGAKLISRGQRNKPD